MLQVVSEGNGLIWSQVWMEYEKIPLAMRIMAPVVVGIIFFVLWRASWRRALAKAAYTAHLEAYSYKLEEQNNVLHNLNDSLDSLIYTTSHDLKTPVVNLVGLLRMLRVFRDRPDGAEEEERIIGKLEVSATRLLTTIDDLLLVSKLEREEQEAPEILSIHEMTNGVLSQLKPLLEEKGARVVLGTEEARRLLMPRTSLEALLQNLVSNAIHFSHPDRQPEIEVVAKNHNGMLAIEISDNGIGIDLDAQKDKLFGMFSRLHNQSKGSGIGLYIVKKIMDKMGGEVKVSSQVGIGSTFTLIFPENYILE